MSQVLAARPEHNQMMARQLPGLEDEFFLKLQAAVHGQYQPLAAPARDQTPQGIGARLARVHGRAMSAIHRYQSKGR